jgi:hypothetical protein
MIKKIFNCIKNFKKKEVFKAPLNINELQSFISKNNNILVKISEVLYIDKGLTVKTKYNMAGNSSTISLDFYEKNKRYSINNFKVKGNVIEIDKKYKPIIETLNKFTPNTRTVKISYLTDEVDEKHPHLFVSNGELFINYRMVKKEYIVSTDLLNSNCIIDIESDKNIFTSKKPTIFSDKETNKKYTLYMNAKGELFLREVSK